MSYRTHFAEHLRLALLQQLEAVPGYQANAAILQTLVAAIGVPASRDQVRAELAWLAEQGLVEIMDVGGLLVATLTERGQDVARGLALVPGVRRPLPSAPGG